MTRTLQRRFVVTAMTAISVLLLCLLGAINIMNIVIVNMEIERTLNIIADNDGGAGTQVPRPNIPDGNLPKDGRKNEYDTFMAANFFVVRFDEGGDIVYTDVSRTSAVSEERAKELATEVYSSSSESGREGSFRYLMRSTRGWSGSLVVFLDTSSERFSYIRVMLLSGAAGVLCWVLMLAFVVLLSRRAIRPIAENIERQKQFVTNAGHEIKTPLAIIQSNVEALELYNGENKWSRNIREQTVRLGGLMANLLSLARMDEGAPSGKVSEFAFGELVRETLRAFEQPMEAKSVVLHTEIQEIKLRADRAQIEQMLLILLDNAVKYTPGGGTVGVSLRQAGRTLELRIWNTCENIPDVPPDKLFDRFYRADTSRTQKSGGYGIGLAIARSIAEMCGGRLTAGYIHPDMICFTFEKK